VVPDDDWDCCALAFGSPSILQGRVWGDLKARWGWTVHRIASEGDGWAAQVLTRPLPFGGRLAYVPHGPLLAGVTSASQWTRALTTLTSWLRRAGTAVAKLELDVPGPDDDLTAVLGRLGWRPSHEAIQFANTMRSAVDLDPDEHRRRLKPKTRYNIALATRRGVTVRHAGEESLDAFLHLYQETAERDGFALRSAAYYLDAWSAFLRAGQATLLLAEKDGRALAGVLPVAYGPVAYYLYGASAGESRRDMAPYLAQWESLMWARSRGCAVYDWWGGPASSSPADPLAGVARFKTAFGAELVTRLGAWDLPLSPGRYVAYRALTGPRRALLRLGGQWRGSVGSL
jgi:peptidoglycan pentaglycine glycine transferase (the first glycine)